jgi:hypothetical protein
LKNGRCLCQNVFWNDKGCLLAIESANAQRDRFNTFTVAEIGFQTKMR